ncbi:MAG: CoA transferase, partial [Alphaproteobacteria bacterium]|nr:CoA transferase [Alphaproteobacteria bacterium]
PTEGRLLHMRPPVSFSKTPGSIRRQAPQAGQHSEEVLREAGFDGAEVQALIDAGVTATAAEP